ncbi:QacE family quaternary ammonium compound efflux SMR transporter [Labedella phragmitis]|uniref:QacE family quaternary ammonium compound efflux SMR transporter n=1 Tax=Labedella phragmitis TaxID=2498849 RepID=A0A3S3ZDF6_9MICO|nr:SMR family transporter [Labedella phragmitis]RWZ53064.1 QacE family quaternary ammonium compound efflux SMR transporter [Labedella phragmitis]
MTAWLFLVGAILTEVTATLSLRAAVGERDESAATRNPGRRRRRRWYVIVAVGYVSAFSLLSLSLGAGMPLGIAYGVWAAAGVAITAVASAVIFKEPFTVLMATGIALIMGGVLLVELGASH